MDAEVKYGMNWDQYLTYNYPVLAVAFVLLEFQMYLNHWGWIKMMLVTSVEQAQINAGVNFAVWWESLEEVYPAVE